VERQGDGPRWNDDPSHWEHQGLPLTVADLAHALVAVDPALPVLVASYDGAAEPPLCPPVEVGLVGEGDQPDALVITVSQID